MNIYHVYLKAYGHVWYQDVNCPTYWLGSGVYDVDVEVEVPIDCYVAADTEERAKELAEEYDYDPSEFTLDDVEVEDIELVKTGEEDPEEVYDITIGKLPVNDGPDY